MAPLEAGKLFRFPNLWGDKRQHYGHVSWLASYEVRPGVSPGITRKSDDEGRRESLLATAQNHNATRECNLTGRYRIPSELGIVGVHASLTESSSRFAE